MKCFLLRISSIIFFSVILSLLWTAELNAQVSGTVFRDFDGDGIQTINQPGLDEPGLEGIVINVYNTSNQIIASYVSGANGAYSIPSGGGAYNGTEGSNTGLAPAGASIRVEFIIPPAVADVCGLDASADYSGFNGDAYGSSVQFVTGGATDINFAVQAPGEFRTDDIPTIFIPCFVNGDPLAGGNSGEAEWFVAFPYTNSGTQMPSDKLNGTILGSVHGVAYSKQANRVFTSAFLKRHAGLGVLGTGGIYSIGYNGDGTFGTISSFYNLDANGHPTRYNGSQGAIAYGNGTSFSAANAPMNSETITYLGPIDPQSGMPAGLGVVGTNVERGLSPSKEEESFDPAAFDQIGKVGLGDMAISDDGRYLFVTNLYTRRIMRIELNNPYNPTGVVAVTSYVIPAVTCGNGLMRPFGLKYYKGKLFVGTVCTGENGGQNVVNGATDLYAQVFELNAADQASPDWTASPLLEFPLNYLKGTSYTLGGCGGTSRWKPWTNTFRTTCNTINFRLVWEQPILSDIEFSDDGSMVLGFMDRMGHMGGGGNLDLVPNGNDDDLLWYVSTGGDVLKVFVDEDEPCSYRLEASTDRTATQNNNQGPDGGEFFYTDFYDNHHETSQGGLIWLPGTNEVISTVMDPIAINSGGLKWLSTETGATNKNYQLYAGVGQVGLLGKANGLGAMDFSRETPPLEIGNRVWLDVDEDGIQDADEPGIDGLVVEIYLNGLKVGETTTSNGGHYYFNDDNVTLNGAGGLVPLTEYELIIAMDQTPLTGFILTILNADSPGLSFVRDNDAVLMNGDAVILYTTGNSGENDHTLDYGFFQASSCPDFTDAPDNVMIIDSECVDCVLGDGLITAPQNACPGGSSIEYSTNNGATWSTTLPVYDNNNTISIITRCVCDLDDSIISNSSSEVTTNPGVCPIDCDCPVLTGPPSDIIIVDSDCIDCELTPGTITVPDSPCPAGSFIQFSTDGGLNWTTIAPIYDQDNVISFITRCLCEVDPNTSGEESDVYTTSPATCPIDCGCPDFDGFPGDIEIVNSECIDCTLTPGQINIPATTCPDGSSIQFSYNGGLNWTSTAPIYNMNNSVTFLIRCDCDEQPDLSSEVSDSYTTNPGDCPAQCDCPDLSVAPDNVTINNSDCVDCELGTGEIIAPENACPTGSVLQYSTDDGNNWSIVLPIYDQDNIITITTRCVCEEDDTNVSPGSTEVSTNPGVCPPDCFLPDCEIEILNVEVSPCEPFTSSYSLSVTVNYRNINDDVLTINGVDFVTASGTNITETFVIEGLDANGTSDISVSAQFASDVDCSDMLVNAYDSPDACEPSCPEDFTLAEEDITINALSLYTLPICVQELMVSILVEIDNPCEQFFNPDNLDPDFGDLVYTISSSGVDFIEYNVILKPGDYSWIFTYTNPNGEMVSTISDVTVDLEPNIPAILDMPGTQVYTISYCAEDEVVFEIVITDDCDNPINPNGAEFTLCGEPLIPLTFDEGTGTFTFLIPVTDDLDGCQITALYTDSFGNETFNSTDVIVNGTQDELPPVIIYPSNEINLTLGDCEEALNYCFYVTAVDDCDGDLEPIVMINGEIFEPIPGTNSYCLDIDSPGDLDVIIEATDSNGNTSQEDFTIVIAEGPEATVNLACIDQINVTLDSECQVPITASMLLSGSFGCLSDSDFTIRITNNGVEVDNPIGICGLFMYEIELNEGVDANFSGCWGNLLVEDKRPPVVNCPDNEISCNRVDELLGAGGLTPEQLAALFDFDLPTVSDNCGIGSIVYTIGDIASDTGSPDDICADRYIPITFTVTDICGTTNSCVSEVVIVPDDLMSICDQLINWDGTDTMAISCTDSRLGNPAFVDENNNPLPSWTGAPANQSCNIQCAYEDLNIPLCGVDVNSIANARAARKIARTWTCVDWCIGGTMGQQIQTCVQIIKIKDDVEPVLTPQDLALKVMNNDDCNYSIVFREPTVLELCSGLGAVQISINGGPFQPFVNGFYPSQTLQPESARRAQLPVGENVIVYRVVDDCGNVGTATETIILEDKTPPIAICETFRVASLGADCRVRIFADAFDDGSYDNCGPIEMHVRRMAVVGANGQPSLGMMPGINCYEPFAGSGPENVRRFNNYNTYRDWVDFCCDDFDSDQSARMVEFRITDEAGNSNTCMVFVEVQDKIPPTGVRPPDLTIDCNDAIMHFDFNNLTAEQSAILDEMFGTIILEDLHTTPSLRRPISVAVNNPRIDEVQAGVAFLDGRAWDNCGGTACFSMEQSASFAAGDCNTGTINRVWMVRDAGGNVLTLRQFITVVNFYPFMGGPNRRAYNSTGYYTTFRQQMVAEDNFDPRTWTKFEPTNNLAGFQNPFSMAGAFRSHFRAVDASSPTNVANGYPTRFDVVWPADLEIDICGQGATPDALEANRLYRSGARPYIWRNDICSQVGVAYDEWNFDFEAGCRKIVRQWKIIDWCQPQSVLNPWMWIQTIKIVDTDGPEILEVIATTAPGEDVIVPCGGDVTFGFLDGCDDPVNKHISLTINGVDACAAADDIVAIRWDWEVYPFGDRSTPIRRSSFPGQNFIPRGDTLNINNAFPRTNPGGPAHVLKIIAEDGCGNKTTCEINFRIEDRKKPTLICFAELSTDLMPEGPMAGSVEVDASIFNNNSSDNCGVNRFRLGQNTAPGQDTYTSGPRHLRVPTNTYGSLIFSCCTSEEGNCETDPSSNVVFINPGQEVEVALWVGDIYGNWDYCIATIQIDNNMGAPCIDIVNMGGILGEVVTEDGSGVSDVIFEVMAAGENMMASLSTNNDGLYSFELPMGGSYTITPERNDNPRNGVNVADIIKIQRHILGVERIDNPYNRIAADVTEDRLITAQDIVAIRRLLLGNTENFTNTLSWKIIPATFDIVDPETILNQTIPVSVDIDVAASDMIDLDWKGIKMGDVNNSVRPNHAFQQIVTRSGAFEFNIDDAELIGGNVYTVAFKAKDLDRLEGYQYTLNFDNTKLSFVDLERKALDINESHFGFERLDQGMITTVWSTSEPITIDDDAVLFELTFRAVGTGKLSDAMWANSGYTEAMAVWNGVEMGLDIVFNGTNESRNYELYQNRPNPFANETLIGFSLPEAMSATLTIFDMTGRVVNQIKGDYFEGMNNIILKKSELPANGVLYYQLEAGDFKATKKMVIIE